MLQFESLSAAGRNIVDNFISENKNIFLSSKKKMELMVSLYAIMEDADTKVLDILHDYIIDLKASLSDEDIKVLRSEYSAVMNYCFQKSDPFTDSTYYVDRSGYTNKTLPKSLLDLCTRLTSPDKGDKVFLPYADYAQMAFFKPEANYFGFEQNADRWALSQIMLHANNVSASIILTQDMHEAMPYDNLFDFIFCMPPFLKGKETRGIADNIYELATKHLAENGALCCIFPESFCYASEWNQIRKIVLDNHRQYSAIVITLPQLPNMYSAIRLCIFCLVNDGNGDIVLMDASQNNAFMVMHDPEYYEGWYINTDSIMATLKHGSSNFVVVGKADMLNDAADLTPSHFLVKRILPEPNSHKGETRQRIGDLIEIVRTASCSSKDSNLPLLGMKELFDNYLNCDIHHEAVPQKKPQAFRTLKDNCLLVGYIGGKFKVGKTVDLSEEQFVCLRPEIIPFRLKNKEVTEEFLLRNFIFNDNLREQARMLSRGVTISRLAPQDLFDLEMIVPSLEEQERICKVDTKQSLSDAAVKIKASYDDFRQDMHMKKHAIGQTLFNLNNWWDALLEARKEGNGVVSDDAITGKIRKVPVASIYDSIQKALNQLQQQINKFDRGNGLVVKKFALTEFIEDYTSRKESPLFTFSYENSMHHASQTLHEVEFNETTGEYRQTGKIILNEGDPIEYVEFAPDALEIIFDNIVSNACCHGFKDRTNNVIKIELKSEGDNYVIIISNNGSAINAQIKPEEVFVYGRSSKMGKSADKNETHFGIGGYEVQKLMREFGGDAEFISDTELEFPVSYKLTFYNTNIESVEL